IYDAYRHYQEALERSNSLDFADLIRLAVRLLQENLPVLNLYRERFRFVLVDEYQDINYAQYMFVRLLAERYENICVVGDDDQAIYGWRGADPGWLLRFEEDFPRAKVVRLRFNYRSPSRVLRALSRLRMKESRSGSTPPATSSMKRTTSPGRSNISGRSRGSSWGISPFFIG
ncbi:MAG: UvrD-helicase domain-containing protein, partial [Candidatus Bipolaricaulia bacterium]